MGNGENAVYPKVDILISEASDSLKTIEYKAVPEGGMRIDREFWGPLQEDECDKFISIRKLSADVARLARDFIKSYISDSRFRDIIENKRFAELNTYTGFSPGDYKNLGDLGIEIPKYIKENIVLKNYAE